MPRFLAVVRLAIATARAAIQTVVCRVVAIAADVDVPLRPAAAQLLAAQHPDRIPDMERADGLVHRHDVLTVGKPCPHEVLWVLDETPVCHQVQTKKLVQARQASLEAGHVTGGYEGQLLLQVLQDVHRLIELRLLGLSYAYSSWC